MARDALMSFRAWLQGGCDSCLFMKMRDMSQGQVTDASAIYKFGSSKPDGNTVWVAEVNSCVVAFPHNRPIGLSDSKYNHRVMNVGDHAYIYDSNTDKTVDLSIAFEAKKVQENHFEINISDLSYGDRSGLLVFKMLGGDVPYAQNYVCWRVPITFT